MVIPKKGSDGVQPVGGGGPFVNCTFYDQATDRVYMLDGSVYAPDDDKMDFVRRMEVMARTFRTPRETEASSDTPVAAE